MLCMDNDLEARRSLELSELLEVMRTEVAKDGGTLTLVSADYNTGAVAISLGGACGTCSLTGTTLEDGVKRILTQRLDWVTEIVGVIDKSEELEGTGNWLPYEI
jgi:Fe-S cluster biogenesis protein NfuA